MYKKPYASKLFAVLGVLIIGLLALVVAPAASAYPGYGGYGYGGGPCVGGYIVVKQYPDPRSPDVCSHPSVAAGMGNYQYVNQISVALRPPGGIVPPYAAIDANLPPCGQFDPATFPPQSNGPYCAVPWVPLGFR